MLYYDLNKITLNRGGSYICTFKWLDDKKATINPKNNDNKCCMYSFVITQDHKQIKDHPERLSNIMPHINKYNWKGIDFPPQTKDWKKTELNNKSIALNILYVSHNTKKIYLAYKSKYNSTRENQAILLMITDGEKWHHLAVTRLSALLRGIASKNNGDYLVIHYLRTAHLMKQKISLIATEGKIV